MTISKQDEREARLWLANAENRQKQNIGKYKYVENDDVRHRATILALLDAAEAGMRARDAALEEAAQIAENACLVPPDGGSPTDAEREMCEEAASLIRKRKGAA